MVYTEVHIKIFVSCEVPLWSDSKPSQFNSCFPQNHHFVAAMSKRKLSKIIGPLDSFIKKTCNSNNANVGNDTTEESVAANDH